MKVKIKPVDPAYDDYDFSPSTDGSAGIDLIVTKVGPLSSEVEFGVAVEIPKNYVGLLVPRSSSKLSLENTIGIIDSDYRGILKGRLAPGGSVFVGDRAFQLVVVPCLTDVEIVSTLSTTQRGEGGFGSTGS